jgi:hypothetical protein
MAKKYMHQDTYLSSPPGEERVVLVGRPERSSQQG